jgi:ATP-dependent DNA helicase 2 subunit 1
MIADRCFCVDHSSSRRYYPYGGAKVFFSDDELKAMKNVGEPGLVLMGFKPYDAIKVYMNYRSSYFIHPDDGQVRERPRGC